eukprot:6214540-Pleurochrysis_carterae.AAC.5
MTLFIRASRGARGNFCLRFGGSQRISGLGREVAMTVAPTPPKKALIHPTHSGGKGFLGGGFFGSHPAAAGGAGALVGARLSPSEAPALL